MTEMRNINFLSKINILFVALLLSACLPKEQDQLECPDGQAFDTSFRKCVSNALLSNSAPFPYGAQTFNLTEKTSSPYTQTFTITAGTDGDGDSLTYLITTPPVYGTITDCMNYTPNDTQPDLTCTYTPNDNDFAGTDTFTYVVNDGITNSPVSALVSLSITGTNDVPTIALDSVLSGAPGGDGSIGTPYVYTVNEGDTITIVLTADEGGYTDEDSQPMRVTLSALTGTQNLEGLTSANFGFVHSIYAGTGAATFNFQDSTLSSDANVLTTTISLPSGTLGLVPDNILFNLAIDDFQDTTTVYFQLDVTGINNPPVFSPTSTQLADVAFTEDGLEAQVNSVDLRAATDAEGGVTVVYELVTAPTGSIRNCMDRDATSSVVAATADLICDYLPPTSTVASGFDTFTYQACEDTTGTNCSLPITVTIAVASVDDEPIFASYANYTAVTMNEKKLIGDANASFTATAGSDDEDGTTLTYEVITPPNSATEGLLRDCMDLDSLGAATGTATNDLDCTFVPIIGYSGTTTFTYKACDTTGNCSIDTTPTNFASADIIVNAIDDPPTITDTTDKTFNEGLTTLSIDINLDEGDGVAEDAQDLLIRVTVTPVDNVLLLPEANITVTTRDSGAYTADTDTAFIAFDTGGGDAADTVLNLAISPVVGQTGTVTVTVEVNDGVNAIVSDTFNVKVEANSALHGGWTNLAAQGDLQTKDGATLTSGEGYVYLAWNTMTVAGGGNVLRWDIYRDIDSNGDGVGDNGTLDILSTPIGSTLVSVRNYSDVDDDAANNLTEGQAYLYKVRPVSDQNSLPMDVSEAYATARVIYPHANWSFVHRWIANQENCTKMGVTPVPTQDFGCAYVGPESTDIGGATYYVKQARDMMVMSYEAGCNYEAAPACTTSGCIGTKDPTAEGYDVSNGAMYYNRDTAICYVQTAASTWTAVNLAALPGDLAGNSLVPTHIYSPPIVNISKANANSYCSGMTQPTYTGATASSVPTLPTKFQFNAIASWDDAVSDTNINNYETGNSLDSSSKCNTSTADGISFVDSEVPASSFADSLPAIASSSVLSRALRTGSDASALCISRYGVQDLIGNVGEWILGDVACAADDTCTTTFNNNGVGGHDFNFDGASGPCADTAPADGTCDGILTTFIIANKLNNGTKFLIPMGLPVDATEATFTDSDIGTAAGNFSPTKLHSDTIIIDGNYINANSDNADASAGGSFDTAGNAAGRYHMSILERGTVDSNEYTGFRCMFEVSYP